MADTKVDLGDEVEPVSPASPELREVHGKRTALTSGRNTDDSSQMVQINIL